VVGGAPARFESFQWHSYEAVPPPGATVLARSAHALQAFRLKDRPAWGIQFHAEVSDADAAHWIEHYEVDPDAVAMGLDPETLARQTEARMPAWHELGRGLFDRFLAAHS
jgi:GMP synthase (glutamine-hydrolysing)